MVLSILMARPQTEDEQMCVLKFRVVVYETNITPKMPFWGLYYFIPNHSSEIDVYHTLFFCPLLFF